MSSMNSPRHFFEMAPFLYARRVSRMALFSILRASFDSVRAVVMGLSVVPPFCAVWMSTQAWPKAADIPAVGDRLSAGVDSSLHVSSLHSHAASSKQVLSSHCGEL